MIRPGVTARSAALQALLAVTRDGETLSQAVPRAVAGLPDARERALAQELAYGVLRWQPRLDAVLLALLIRPLRQGELTLRLVLLLGLYQRLYTRVPPHAALAETIELLGRSGKAWARALATAIFRRLDRETDPVLARADRDPAARHAHPMWLVDTLRRAWPEEWEGILRASNERPPLTVRVSLRRSSREAFAAVLAAAGLAARPTPHAPAGLVVEPAVDTRDLPGFTEGLCSVQDAAAQLAAPLLALAPGLRVLDACAAPGGKTAHILESEPGLAELVAVEREPRRLALLQETLGRLGLVARCLAADAARPQSWWDGPPFDRILLDAPCSATGVIRRHPDIKWRLRSDDLPGLASEQARLLEGLWPLLARGGRLLYATCSILPEENEHQLARFLTAHPEARSVALDVAWGRPRGAGRQTLPGESGMDGFYYALIRRED
jgi:16S rRNA (cytosine967-C5)-methyltransferase